MKNELSGIPNAAKKSWVNGCGGGDLTADNLMIYIIANNYCSSLGMVELISRLVLQCKVSPCCRGYWGPGLFYFFNKWNLIWIYFYVKINFARVYIYSTSIEVRIAHRDLVLIGLLWHKKCFAACRDGAAWKREKCFSGSSLGRVWWRGEKVELTISLQERTKGATVRSSTLK